MTYTPGSPPPPSGDYYPPPGSFPPAAPPQTRNGLAIAGFVLAFLVAPIGLVLCVIALILAGRNRQKGRVLAGFGIVISLAIMAIGITAAVLLGRNITTVADPGCVQGKSAILAVTSPSSDPATLKTQLQTVIDKLGTAASHAKHDTVRSAMSSMRDDYLAVQKALDTGVPPGAALAGKIATDAKAIDDLCTIGGSSS